MGAKYCHHCGMPVSHEQVYCRRCGTLLIQRNYFRVDSRPKPESRSPVEPMLPLAIKVFGAVLLVAAAVAIVGEWFRHR